MTATENAKTPDAPKPVQKSKFPPWSVFTAFVVVIVSYFVSAVGAQGALLLYALLRRWSIADLNVWLETSTVAQFVNFVLIYGLMVAMIVVFMRSYKVPQRLIGLVRPRFTDGALALVAIPIYLLFYVVLLTTLASVFPGIDLEQDQELGFDRVQQGLGLVLTFASLVILPPLVEEYIMRGFLFTSLLGRMRFIWAAILTSILFAVAHLQLGSGAPLLWTAAIDTFILSLVLCYLRYKTGSLWAGIFLHMLKNFVAFLVIFVFQKG